MADAWQPATELERRMDAALYSGSQEAYFRLLADAELVIPIAPELIEGVLANQAQPTWPIGESDGRTHVHVYTSAEAMRSCLGTRYEHFMTLKFSDIADAWPDPRWWLMVDPGLPIQGQLPSWFVRQIADGDARPPIAGTARLPAADLPTADLPAADLPAIDVPATVVPAADLPTTVVPASGASASGASASGASASDVPAAGRPASDLSQTGRLVTESTTAAGPTAGPVGPAGPPVSTPAPAARHEPSRPEFEPANDVERALLDAVAQGDENAFVQVLAGAEAVVPIPADMDYTLRPGRPGFPWQVREIDGRTVMAVFTSPERMRDAAGDRPPSESIPGIADFMKFPFTSVMRYWPDGAYDLVVNPGSPVAGSVPGAQLAGLSEWADQQSIRRPDARFEPQNEIEQRLLDAATRNDADAFFQILLTSQVLIPSDPDTPWGIRPDDADFPWHAVPVLGRRSVQLFTSLKWMHEAIGSSRFVMPAFLDLVTAWPDPDWPLVLNPGTPVSSVLSGEQIRALAAARPAEPRSPAPQPADLRRSPQAAQPTAAADPPAAAEPTAAVAAAADTAAAERARPPESAEPMSNPEPVRSGPQPVAATEPPADAAPPADRSVAALPAGAEPAPVTEVAPEAAPGIEAVSGAEAAPGTEPVPGTGSVPVPGSGRGSAPEPVPGSADRPDADVARGTAGTPDPRQGLAAVPTEFARAPQTSVSDETSLDVFGTASSTADRPAEPPAEFEPGNRIDQELYEAAVTGDTDAFLRVLLAANVLVPIPADAPLDVTPVQPEFRWNAALRDPSSVQIFTSLVRLRETLGAGLDETLPPPRFVYIDFKELITCWPRAGWDMLLNPGTRIGASLKGDQVHALSEWALRVGLIEPPSTGAVPEPPGSAQPGAAQWESLRRAPTAHGATASGGAVREQPVPGQPGSEPAIAEQPVGEAPRPTAAAPLSAGLDDSVHAAAAAAAAAREPEPEHADATGAPYAAPYLDAEEPVAEPGPVPPTVMQKVVPPAHVGWYLEQAYDRVGGFVHPAADVSDLQTPIQLYHALGLFYEDSPFGPDDEGVYVIRWPAYCEHIYRIPFGGQAEEDLRLWGDAGWVLERPPFLGSGFAAGSAGTIREFKVDSTRLPYGAEMYYLSRDRSERFIAVYDPDRLAWLRPEEALPGPDGSDPEAAARHERAEAAQ